MGDQTHWFVCNDADTAQHLWETDPIGLETQYTIFGVDSTQGLRDVMFVKALLLNKGNVTLDSTYVGIWCDPDLGDASDDYVGCDTTYQLGYCYNAEPIDQGYGDRIPAVGIQLLQGPMVPSLSDTAIILGREKFGFKNLAMTAFIRGLKNANSEFDDARHPH